MASVNMPTYVYVLDVLGTSAASAYSLRKLRRFYAGNCIRVRRSSDNTTMDIGFVNNIVDTASIISFVGAGNGFVNIWYDQSGNARNATQATTGSQPSIATSGVINKNNGVPALNFSSTSFTIPCYKFAAPSTNFSAAFVCAVANPTTGNSNQVLGSDSISPFNSSGIYIASQSNSNGTIWNGSGVNYTSSATTTIGANTQFWCSLTSTSANVGNSYRNGFAGNQVTATSWVTGNTSFFNIGQYTSSGGGTVNLLGYYYEHISFASVLSSTQQLNLGTNQSKFYYISQK